VPGQSGSNNGGEKRGGLTKAQWKGITRWIPKEEKSNPLYVMCACALDISHSAPLSEFATNPKEEREDFDMLRLVSKFDIDSPGNICLDILYMICTDPEDNTQVYDTSRLIGRDDQSFVAHFPTATNVYSHMSQISQASSVEANAISFYETINTYSDPLNQVDTVEKCHKRIGRMDKNEIIELKRMLHSNLRDNLPQIKTNETFDQYMNRRAQRNPARGATPARTLARMKRQSKLISRKKREEKKNVSKYGTKSGDPKLGVATSAQVDKSTIGDTKKSSCTKTNDISNEVCTPVDAQVILDEVGKGKDKSDGYVYCGDDYNYDEMVSFVDNLMSEHSIDIDNDEVVAAELAKKCEVRVKRQLGDFNEVFIDAKKKKVSCTCEDYSAERYCPHCAFFEVLQFGKIPSTSCAKSGERWNDIRETCIDILKKTYVDVSIASPMMCTVCKD